MSRPRPKQPKHKSKPNYHLEIIERRLMLSASTGSEGTVAAVPIGFTSPVQGAHWFDSTKPAIAGSTTPVQVITPDEMRAAYGMNLITFGTVVGDGSGQTIAIIDAYDDPNAAADLHTFDQFYNIADPPSFQKLNEVGQPSPLPGVDPLDGWEGEESLDIEWAHVMAPGANIILFEANDPFSLENTVPVAARVPGVSVISMSFGGAEDPNELSEDSADFVSPANHQGVTFVASAGDSGIYAGQGDTTISPNYPASSPNVIAVGGTTLSVNGASYGGEIGWGSGVESADPAGDGGGGGGISLYESKPEYQNFLDDQSTTNRTYPDVAMDADPLTGVAIVDSYDYGSATPWSPSPTGGTSLAAPMFSAIVAVTNQGRTINGLTTLNGPTQTLPELYQLHENDFHDITEGNNGYSAGPGYDLVTGRGSPVADLLVSDLSSNLVGFHVFFDLNVNGSQDSGEAGVAGVMMSLEKPGPDGIIGTADDVVVATTTTDAYGLYDFTNITPGNYYVHLTAPLGYKISPLGTSTALTTNSGFDTNGNSSLINVTSGLYDPFVNGGVHTETISINDVTISRPHSGLAPMVFTVSITPANTVETDVPFSTADDTAKVSNNDYIPISGTLVFPIGATSETITVDAVGNLTIENDVDFHVNITPPAGYYPLKTVGIGTILNTNFPAAAVAGSPTLERSSTQILNFTFGITLSAPAPFTVTVPYSTSDGTAVAGIDYLATSGTVTFDANTTGPQYVTVEVFPGTNRELNKTFNLNVGSSATATAGIPAEAVGTILTNAPPALSISAAQVTESATAPVFYLPFEVDIAPSLTGAVSVNYATADGTAIAGKDYQATSGTLTFIPGRIQQFVNVPVYQQFIAQQDKTLTLNLSNVVGAVELLNTSITGTIHYVTLAALAFSAKQKAVYYDGLNQRVTVTMRGIGSGDVVFLGGSSNETNAYEILTNGTNAGSGVQVRVAGGGQTTFDDFIASSTIGSIDAPTLNILSSVSVTGGLSSLKLGYVAGAAITIGSSTTTPATAMTFNRALNTTITSATPISTLTAGAYLNTTGSALDITAPSVGKVKVTGNFGGTIVTNNIVSLNVGGTIDNGAILATGNIGSVTADSITASSFFAGIASGATTVPTAEADFVNQKSLIGKIKVAHGGVFSNTVIAGWDVQSVSVGAVTGTASGVTANHVGTVTAAIAGRTESVKNPAVKSAVSGISVDLV
jgi:subtilase family serine protease